MTDAEIIDALGGSAAVATLLGVPQSTVSNWKLRGISWPMRVIIREFAVRKRIKVPLNLLKEKGL